MCDDFFSRKLEPKCNSHRSLEVCADVHNTKETTHNWEDTESQGTTACNRHATAPSRRLPRVRTTDHKRMPETLYLNGLQDPLTHVQLYSSPIAVHVKAFSTYLESTTTQSILSCVSQYCGGFAHCSLLVFCKALLLASNFYERLSWSA